MDITQDTKKKQPRKLQCRPPMKLPSTPRNTALPVQRLPQPGNIPQNPYGQQLVLPQSVPAPPRVEMNQVLFQFQRHNFQPVLGGPSQAMPAVFRLKSCFQRKDLHVSFSNIEEYLETEPRDNQYIAPYVSIRDPVKRRRSRKWGKRTIDPDSPYCAVCHIFRRFRGWHTCPLHSNIAKWTIGPPLPRNLEAEHPCHCQMGLATRGHVFCDYCEQGGAVGDQAVRMLKEVGFTPDVNADHTLYFKNGYDRYMNIISWHREKMAEDRMTNAWPKIACAPPWVFLERTPEAGPRAA